MSVRLRAAPLSGPLEGCRSCAIKIKPGSSKSSGAQTQQPWVSTLAGETQGRLCQEERGFLGPPGAVPALACDTVPQTPLKIHHI